MIYVDTSVWLRLLLDEPDQLVEPLTDPVSSALTEVEVFRSFDRLRLSGKLSSTELGELHAHAHDLFARIRLVNVSPAFLVRAAQPFPTTLGTLDAIHLATALSLRDVYPALEVVATHGQALGLASRAAGFSVTGLKS